MRYHDLQGVEIEAPFARVFGYIGEPANLPEWTNAFASVSPGRAVMRTPAGETEVGLQVRAEPALGTVDWEMTFPDGSSAHAYSRVVALGPERCAYSFVLPPPPAPLEKLEGVLAEQSAVLAKELGALKRRLEA